MTVTVKVNTNAVSGLELTAKVDTLGDVQKLGRKLDTWLAGVLRINKAWRDAKVTSLVLGKE